MEYERYDYKNRQARGFDVLVFLSGVWLMTSPFLLSYSSGALAVNQVIFGIIISVLAIVRFFVHESIWASWFSALSGFWMMLSPLIISGASASVYWSSIVSGLIVMLLSVALTSETLEPAERRIHHGPPV